MSQPTETERTIGEPALGQWQAAVAGGIVGSIVMGGLMFVQMRGVLAMAIPAMYTIEGPALAAGFALHVLHGAVLALGFAALTEAVPGVVSSAARSIGFGVGYGVLVWAVAAVVVMPIWLSAVGFPEAPPLPNVSPLSLVAHAVYGAVLGAAVATLR